MQCPKCKQVLDTGIKYCPHDGTPLVETSAPRTVATPTGGKRPTSPDLPLPVVIGNRYRLEELRGGGGMAKVYRAHDLNLEREVAVKLINPELRNEFEFDARFQREARIASNLSDPHIVVVHDYGLDATHGPYLVMEFLQGMSLRERLRADTRLPLKATLQLAGQLFLALIHAHSKGIIHRDIKPDNIFLLNQSGVRLHVRVLDFGIARIYTGDDGKKAETITHAGAVLGTPRYMSPEQLAGKPVDVRSDLFSAALVIFESLTGELPYAQGKRLCELCPDASQGLQELLEQCLKPDPAERPPTAVEVYLRLQELGKASGILLLPPGAMDRLVAARTTGEPTIPYEPPQPRPRRRTLLWAALALVLLGGGTWAWWLFSPPGPFPTDSDSLFGIHIDDPLEDVEKKLPQVSARIDHGNPWQMHRTKSAMGLVLRPEDLGLDEAKMKALTIRRNADDTICVLFHEDRVVGLVTTSRQASTTRRVGVGTEISRVHKLYDNHDNQRPDVADVDLPEGGHAEIRRYPRLGIGFEIQGGKVSGMALYRDKR